MASDIPATGFSASIDMARVLVTYIDCPRRVRSAILGEFNTSPDVTTIERLRREHLNQKPAAEPIRHNDAYYPHEAASRFDETNRRFLMRLQIERTLSARANGNLIEAGRDAT